MSEREKLIELISRFQWMGGLEEMLADYLLSHGVTVPVRCEECKHWKDYSCGIQVCAKFYKKDYCSYGERKDNG